MSDAPAATLDSLAQQHMEILTQLLTARADYSILLATVRRMDAATSGLLGEAHSLHGRLSRFAPLRDSVLNRFSEFEDVVDAHFNDHLLRLETRLDQLSQGLEERLNRIEMLLEDREP